MVILNIFKKEKSLMELEDTEQVLLPVKAVLAEAKEIAFFQDITLLLNLA
jgi:hypothetical protein